MTLPRPKAVIFDWDGTLADTWHVVHAALNQTFPVMGAPQWTEEEARVRIGKPARALFTEMFGEEKWQEADAHYIKAYEHSIPGRLHMMKGAGAMLNAVKAAGIPAFILSTKRGTLLREEVKHAGLVDRFVRVVGAGDAPQDKPEPESVIHVLSALGFQPGPDIWFYGDSAVDMQCAASTGCTGILFEENAQPETVKKWPPAARCASHAEFVTLLKRSCGI